MHKKQMTDFPVITSTLSPVEIAKYVSEKYLLAGDTTCKLLKAGINHTYRLENEKDTYIFRVYSYNWRTKEEILEELNLLHMLKQNDLPVSYPIPDYAGNFIQTIKAPEGFRFAVLFSFAPGSKIQNYGSDIHFRVGRLMARIHQLTSELVLRRISYTPEVLLRHSLNNIKALLPDDTDEMRFLISSAGVLEKQLLQADTAELRKGIVHLDIWFDNLTITEKNEIILFDFDFCGNGWLCLDLAYYIMQLHNIEKDEMERAAKIEAFYQGYETIEKIGEMERDLIAALGVALLYYYLGVQCKRFDNWSNTFLNEVYLKRYITVFIKSYYQKSGGNVNRA